MTFFSLSWPALVGGVTIKTPHGVDVLLHRPASHHIFPTGLVKTESESLDQMRLTQRKMNAGSSCD